VVLVRFKDPGFFERLPFELEKLDARVAGFFKLTEAFDVPDRSAAADIIDGAWHITYEFMYFGLVRHSNLRCFGTVILQRSQA
jgi:hypothetical protein